MLVVDDPVKLALREEGVDEVEAAEASDVDFAEVKGLDHPEVSQVAVTVFVGP